MESDVILLSDRTTDGGSDDEEAGSLSSSIEGKLDCVLLRPQRFHLLSNL